MVKKYFDFEDSDKETHPFPGVDTDGDYGTMATPKSRRKRSLSPVRKVSFLVDEGDEEKEKVEIKKRVMARKISFDNKIADEFEEESLKILFTGGPCAGN